jgi:hypothetical protein
MALIISGLANFRANEAAAHRVEDERSRQEIPSRRVFGRIRRPMISHPGPMISREVATEELDPTISGVTVTWGFSAHSRSYGNTTHWVAEREGFEPSVPVTQYARLATPRRVANGVTSARLLKTVPTMAGWLASSTAIPPSLAESH